MRWAAAAPLLLAAVASAADEPQAARKADGRLELCRLPAILAEEAVAPHLTSGLTSTVVFRVVARRGRAKIEGGAAVDLRYELWNEVFLAAVSEAGGSAREATLTSLDELDSWWRSLCLTVLPASALAGEGWRARVEAAFLPFSEREQRQAQRWFAKSLGSSGDTPASGVGERSGDLRAQMLDILVTTSIARRSTVRFQWTVEVQTTSDPGAEP